MSRADQAQAQIDIARAYRALFLDEDGGLKPEADIVLRDLERESGAARKSMPTIKDGSVDPMRIVENFAKVAMYRHVKERLFVPLERLKRLTETDK